MDDKPQLEGWELDYATLLVGADTLFGGNIGSPKGVDHGLVDAWTSDYGLPPIYQDTRAAVLREQHGITHNTPQGLVDSFARDHNLRELRYRILEQVDNFEPDRIAYIRSTVEAADIIVETMQAIAANRPLPAYDRRRATATCQDYGEAKERVPAIVLDNAQQELRLRLANAGYEVTTSRSLRETYLAWESAQERIPPEAMQARAQETIRELLALSRERILAPLDFEIKGCRQDLSDVAFDGIDFKTVKGAFYTMSMAYQGGEKEGKPALRALYEYNTDHPQTDASLFFLIGHEGMPGHYLNSAITDLLYRAGKLGFEATIPTMCTASVVFQEGWGNVGTEMLYGGKETAIEALGANHGVIVAHMFLEDIAKHDASVIYQVEGRKIDDVECYVAKECAQSDPHVKKLSSAWTRDPVIGPMYAPAYYLGTQVLRQAIADHGVEAVARVGLQLDGLVDIATFARKVNPRVCGVASGFK